jgi:hypothetical protein
MAFGRTQKVGRFSWSRGGAPACGAPAFKNACPTVGRSRPENGPAASVSNLQTVKSSAPPFGLRTGLKHNKRRTVRNFHPGKAAGKGLFGHVRVKQNARSKNAPLPVKNAPSICIVFPTGVSMAHGDRERPRCPARTRVGRFDNGRIGTSRIGVVCHGHCKKCEMSQKFHFASMT